MPRILVAGATGHLGRAVLYALKERGWWIRALSRQPDAALPDADEIAVGDLRVPATLPATCADVDAVFSAAGASLNLGFAFRSPTYRQIDFEGNRNLLAAAQEAGVARFVYVSVFNTPVYADTAYVRAHEDFADLLKASGLGYGVVRPTGFFSAFEALLPMVQRGIAPLIGGGTARTNPIHADDLADVCADVIEGENQELDVGGPEVLTRKDVFERAFEVVGKPPRFVSVPSAVLSVNKILVRPLDPRLSDLLDFFQRIGQTDVVAPAYGTRRLDAYFRESLSQRS